MNKRDYMTSFYELMYSQEFDPKDLDYELFDRSIVFLERLAEVENSSVNVYDFNRRKYVFMRSKFSDQLGHNINQVKEEGPFFYLELIHPDDLPGVVKTTERVFTFLQSIPADERKNYKVVYNCRIKGNKGKYLHFLQQNIVLELDRKGNIWLLMTISDLLPDYSQYSEFEPRLFNIRTGKQYLFSDDNLRKSSSILTIREIEILSLSSKGLASKEIADQLYLSVNTVNNHRQKIMGKTKATNTTEAITYARNLGLL